MPLTIYDVRRGDYIKVFGRTGYEKIFRIDSTPHPKLSGQFETWFVVTVRSEQFSRSDIISYHKKEEVKNK